MQGKTRKQLLPSLLLTSVLAGLLTLTACSSDTSPVATNATNTTPQEVPFTGAPIMLDLSCDQATYPSAKMLQCELGNVARTLEANLEQLNPLFVAQQIQQTGANIQFLLQRSLQDPSWNLPPAIGNSPVTPLCAAGAGPCVGDPFRYPGVNGPDGDVFYTQEAEVTPVVYYDQGCARISGQVWKPRTTGNSTLPAVIIKNGSVQANEALYWWAAQALVRAGYMVLTNDPRGQGLSDFATPTGEQGGNVNGKVFYEGLVNDIDFLMSTPGKPYPHEQRCTGTYPTATQAFNPFHAQLDPNRIGAAGHSYGAGGVSWVQSYGAPDSRPWPGLLSPTNPLKAIVAWDALGSRNTPAAATLTSLIDSSTVNRLPLVGLLTMPQDAPPISPRVPALGFTSEYGFTPVPFVRNMPRDEHLAGFKEWSAANVPAFNITIAGSTHLDYSPGPALPASSWCKEIKNNACVGGWAQPMITHYTVAWFDRFLKVPGEKGFADADARLLDDATWAERMSFHFASARKFSTRDGRRVATEDIRLSYAEK
ncbi:hypothetical protein EV673_0014 [Limnobacter thiooxidans]|uniref:Uncharacterized protein n=1 Tax=Limnobacter thiooxidans TaxID=131080 RepID=A0AA86J342_9BURK|nr:hypothetical protein EV673_0014 [Limnobacter thiooxidans]BET26866.1 hypothetical protein RGQ30_23670 [Limnobacter thiooxidans]